jgi:hypothetical protein
VLDEHQAPSREVAAELIRPKPSPTKRCFADRPKSTAIDECDDPVQRRMIRRYVRCRILPARC